MGLERQTEIITSGWSLRGHQIRKRQNVRAAGNPVTASSRPLEILAARAMQEFSRHK
jgi:hypothetical protein